MIHALLVGINSYKSENISNLNGCKTDVANMLAFLQSRFTKEELNYKTIQDFQAKKETLIYEMGTGLFLNEEEKFIAPKQEDIVLFYFSGHGSQEPGHQAFGGGKNETFICFDSRTDGIPDLADKEIAALMAKIAVNKPHLVLIFDSCHSGSISRDPDDFKLGKARFSPGSNIPRELNDYLPGFYPEKDSDSNGYYTDLWDGKNEIQVPVFKHILLSACEKTEKAYELRDEPAGVFTTTLLKVLAEDVNISYSNAFVQTRGMIKHRAFNQNPQFENHHGFNAYYSFLSNKINNAPSPIPVYRKTDDGFFNSVPYWALGRGAMHGIPTDIATTVSVDIYLGDSLIAKAETENIQPESSKLKIVEGEDKLDVSEEKYKGIISSLPSKPLLISIQGADEKIIASLKEELQGSFPLSFVEKKVAEFSIRISPANQQDQDDIFQIFHRTSQIQIGGAQGPVEEIAPYLYNEILSAIHRWKILKELTNSAPKLDPQKVSFELITYEDEAKTKEAAIYEEDCTLLCHRFENEDGSITWDSLEHQLRVSNNSHQALYVSIFELNHTYGFYPLGPQMEIESKTQKFLNLGSKGDDGNWEDISTGNIQYIADKGTPDSINTIYKLIISTERYDDFLWEQKDLDFSKIEKVSKRFRASKKKYKGPKPVKNDWFTKKIEISLIKNQKRLEAAGADTEKPEDLKLAGDMISIEAHAGLSAAVALKGAETHSRSESISVLPSLMEEMGMQALNFSQDPQLINNVLELSEIQEKADAKVSIDNPLKMHLRLPTDIEEGEILLPFSFDGEHILPIGKMSDWEKNHVSLNIEQIPEEISRKKGVGKALKMVIGRIFLGWKDEKLYKLRWVDFWGEKAEFKKEGLKDKVKQANKILICIHGIIGETKTIVPAVKFAVEDGHYDLVLSFDYENLKGPIEKIASEFQTLLREEAGIDASVKRKGKIVDILAHSMGGLVSRWFIEREDGHNIINRLILAGTPSGGSPFGEIPQYRDLAMTALTIGMNFPFLSHLAPLAGGLLGALSITKPVTKTLDQMNDDSDFLQTLNNSADPKIPYIVLAGSLRLYEEMLDKRREGGKSVKSLLDKVFIGVGDLFSEDNDLAVHLSSIRNIPSGRTIEVSEPQPDLACHHLNYFETDENNPAWEVLKKVLSKKNNSSRF